MTKRVAGTTPSRPASQKRRLSIETYFDVDTVRAAASELIPSIDDLLKTEPGQVVCNRLMASQDAINSFLAIAIDDHAKLLIVSACIEAEHLKRTFRSRIDRAKAMRRKLTNLRMAANDLYKFIDNTPRDLLPAEIVIEAAATYTIYKGLCEMAPWLKAALANAGETAQRVGATRKVNMRQAAETAAIAMLASAIKQACGRPHYKHVAVLAGTVLDTAEAVSIDRVRAALQKRASGPFAPKKGT